MSKKSVLNFSIFFIFLSFLALQPLKAEISDPAGTLKEADQRFDSDKYTEAIDQYTALFQEGHYSEKMLYRLAFMHEKLENFPEAIFFLRKAAQEYGDRGTEDKVRKIMRARGVLRIYTSDGWDAYYAFFRTWGALIWGLFVAATLVLLLHFFLPQSFNFKARKPAYHTSWVFFILMGAILFYHHVETPTRAVIVKDTSFYTSPSYAAEHNKEAFSLGELVTITSEEDIWVEVNAGGREWWVPKMVVREL